MTPLKIKHMQSILWGCPWIILKLRHMGHTWVLQDPIFKSGPDTSYNYADCGGTTGLSAKRRTLFGLDRVVVTPLDLKHFVEVPQVSS